MTCMLQYNSGSNTLFSTLDMMRLVMFAQNRCQAQKFTFYSNSNQSGHLYIFQFADWLGNKDDPTYKQAMFQMDTK